MTEDREQGQAYRAWLKHYDAFDWTGPQAEQISSIRDAFCAGWSERDRRDTEPLRPGTIILLRPKTDDGAATAAVRYQAGWVRADPTSRSDYYWPFSQLIAGFDSWEIVWEPAS